jgi:hypothetical protein
MWNFGSPPSGSYKVSRHVASGDVSKPLRRLTLCVMLLPVP